MNKLIIVAALVHVIGDASLQIGTKMGADWGLEDYFKQHNPIEALFIAGFMGVLFYAIYIALKLPLNYISMAIYAIILDLLWRKLNIFPSLNGYYKRFGYIQSALWEVIAMLLPLFFYRLF
jgi:hypothetical protein